MHKSLPFILGALVSLSASSSLFAANFDAEAIKQIHTQVQANMSKRCITEIPHASQSMCDCLGNKLQSNIDDAALSKCPNDASGKDCVMKVAQDATMKTITPETMKECMPQDAKSAAASPAAPAAPAPAQK